MISGASEQDLELANARAEVIMALDNTSTYESWLIIDTYIESLEEEIKRCEKANVILDNETTELMGENAELRNQIEWYETTLSRVRSEKEKYRNNWNELKNYIQEKITIIEKVLQQSVELKQIKAIGDFNLRLSSYKDMQGQMQELEKEVE